jgi:hypothetical protein
MESQLFTKIAKISVLIILVLLIVYKAIKDTREGNKDAQRISDEYPMVNNGNVDGSITSVIDNRGVSLIDLGYKKIALKHSRNYNYKTFELCYFLEFNDSISKKKNSDTLFIFRGTQEYYFILGKEIGEKYKSKFYRSP